MQTEHSSMREAGNRKADQQRSSTMACCLIKASIQKQFECCGFDDYEDWGPILNDTNKIAPKSCCENPGLCIMSITPSKVYKKGCGKMFEEWLEKYVTLAGGIIIGIAVLQLFSIVVALVFARQKKNETV